MFDGPTECTLHCFTRIHNHKLIRVLAIAFPEDDRLEYELNAAEKRHDQIQATLNAESRAAEILARAVKYMDGCQSNMEEALEYSRYGALTRFLKYPVTDDLGLP